MAAPETGADPDPPLRTSRWQRQAWRTPEAAMLAVLVAGVLLRLGLWPFLGPFNNDNHFEIVQHIFRTGAPPCSVLYKQAYHPPLYYLLASPLLLVDGAKAVQALSVLFSVATLGVLYALVRTPTFAPSPWVRLACLALAAFLPQFVQFGSYVSNDSLTYLLGAVFMLQLRRFLRQPGEGAALVLALYGGLGLLTKVTFLAYLPVGLAVVALGLHRAGYRPTRALAATALCATLAGVVGGYKFAENAIYLGDPLYSNLRMSWVQDQRPADAGGLRRFLDVNLLTLMRYPTVDEHSIHSYPLMLYGSFWYQYVPESTFHGNVTRLRFLGSAIYLVALVPTVLMAAGAVRLLRRSRRLLAPGGLGPDEWAAGVLELAAVLMLAANLALLLMAGLSSGVWSVFQSRSCFGAFFGVLVLLARGFETAAVRRRLLHAAAGCVVGLYALFAAYFGSEVVLSRLDPVDPYRTFHLRRYEPQPPAGRVPRRAPAVPAGGHASPG